MGGDAMGLGVNVLQRPSDQVSRWLGHLMEIDQLKQPLQAFNPGP